MCLHTFSNCFQKFLDSNLRCKKNQSFQFTSWNFNIKLQSLIFCSIAKKTLQQIKVPTDLGFEFTVKFVTRMKTLCLNPAATQ